jgi:hypothetical protein
MRTRVLAVGAALLSAVAATALPASAQTVRVGDPRESFLPARLDLTGARYTLDTNGFAAKVTVRNLRTGTYTLGFNLSRANEEIHVTVTRFQNGKTITTITVTTKEEVVVRHCGGLDTTWRNKRDFIKVDIPWRCLDNVRKDLNVQTFFGAGRGTSGDPADFLDTVKVRYN